MSERKWATTFVIAALALGCFWGRWIGRAEQKKLDEAECAAHPVVAMEFSGEIRVLKIQMDADGTYRTWLGIPAGWVPDGWKLVESAPPPKPKKESKRPVCEIIGEQVVCDGKVLDGGSSNGVPAEPKP